MTSPCLSLNSSQLTELLVQNQRRALVTIPFQIYCILTGVVGAIGNLIVIRIYTKRAHKTSATYFILTLAAIDLCVCVTVVPFVVIHEAFLKYTFTNELACKIFEWLRHSSLSISCLTLGFIAVDRYIAICHPLSFYIRKGRVRAAICISFIVGATFQSQTLFIMGTRTTLIDGDLVGCRCDIKDAFHRKPQHAYFVGALLSLYVLLFIIIVICYVCVCRKVRKRHEARRSLQNDLMPYPPRRTSGGCCCLFNRVTPETSEDGHIDTDQHKEISLSKVIPKNVDNAGPSSSNSHRKSSQSMTKGLIQKKDQELLEDSDSIEFKAREIYKETVIEEADNDNEGEDNIEYNLRKKRISDVSHSKSIDSNVSDNEVNLDVKKLKHPERRLSKTSVSPSEVSLKKTLTVPSHLHPSRELPSLGSPQESIGLSNDSVLSLKDESRHSVFRRMSSINSQESSEGLNQEDNVSVVDLEGAGQDRSARRSDRRILNRIESVRSIDFRSHFLPRIQRMNYVDEHQVEQETGHTDIPRASSGSCFSRLCCCWKDKPTQDNSENSSHRKRSIFCCCASVHSQPLHMSESMETAVNSFQQTRYKTARLLLIVTIVFLLSWLPFWVTDILMYFREDMWYTVRGYRLNFLLVARHFYLVNNMANPFIYAFHNQRFRADLKKTFEPFLKRVHRPACCKNS